ncbi:hypothetical protein AAFF_G00273730 [Aldrovandia affinis]|uniref:Uncharacterized protein n=1 Tax=Aldrovandia affinis TaxID=143900 RepID=A0AAD7WS82_9TELE|nr:hypothetical protein AAFF_G00273730 [Aldrovandia affinis]
MEAEDKQPERLAPAQTHSGEGVESRCGGVLRSRVYRSPTRPRCASPDGAESPRHSGARPKDLDRGDAERPETWPLANTRPPRRDFISALTRPVYVHATV